jgi:hypothetical protein
MFRLPLSCTTRTLAWCSTAAGRATLTLPVQVEALRGGCCPVPLFYKGYPLHAFQSVVLPPYSGEKNEVSSWFVGIGVGPAAAVLGAGGADGTGVTVTREASGVEGRRTAASSSGS